ncbi:MAG: zf-HC2 domain-containing protein [Planctomycetota bacterium]|nr:zf-HC2 domain-containing protein [Planctomycetota bacterium]
MNCEQTRECLSEYVDGEIQNPVEKAEIEAHLAVCGACREALARARKFTTTVIQTVGPLRPKEGFKDRVMARVKSRSRRASKAAIPGGESATYPLWPWALGAALVAAAGIAILLGGRVPPIGSIGRNPNMLKIYRYEGGEWREVPVSARIPAGARVEVAGGEPVPAIELENGRLVLQGPANVSLLAREEAIVAVFSSAGRAFFATSGKAGRRMEFEAGRVTVRIDADAEGEKAADVTVAPDGTVTCAVRTGAAVLTGPGSQRPVVIAEGFQVSWSQNGPPGKPAAIPPDVFGWALSAR